MQAALDDAYIDRMAVLLPAGRTFVLARQLRAVQRFGFQRQQKPLPCRRCRLRRGRHRDRSVGRYSQERHSAVCRRFCRCLRRPGTPDKGQAGPVNRHNDAGLSTPSNSSNFATRQLDTAVVPLTIAKGGGDGGGGGISAGDAGARAAAVGYGTGTL